MYRRWLVLTMVMVVGVNAQARPEAAAAAPPMQLMAATRGAEVAASAAEQRVARLSVLRASLEKRYESEVAAIDRLKRQHASWRRDRDLRDSMSASLETSNQLEAATREVERARRGLIDARRVYLAAIDAELRSGVLPQRAQQLGRTRLLLASQVKDAPRRIVLPDLDIDPLADPEELVQRATELRASEEELSRQVDALDAQAVELERTAQLRKQHSRAGDLVARYDDQPHRSPGRDASAADASDAPGPPMRVPSAPEPPPAFETSVPTVLADVIDASTLNTLEAAQLSGDPAQRAAATRKAHDAVALRLEQVRKKRSEIEARARRLLHKR